MSSTQQSSALVMISVTTEEMSQASMGAVERSKQIQEYATKANELSIQMKNQIENTCNNFNMLNKKIESIENQIETLLNTSEAVDDIVSGISTIAQQSSLLAINASIEAAKAKEHGFGFGILAKEMKNLSEQSRRSTKTAKEKLKNIQNAVKETGASIIEGRQI